MSLTLNPVRAAGNDLVLVCGSFAPNGASNPVVTGIFNAQEFVSIIHTGTGVFTITFQEAYAEVAHLLCPAIALSANLDLKAQYGAFTAATPGVKATLVLNILAVNTLTDIAANAANRVSFGALFRLTTFQR